MFGRENDKNICSWTFSTIPTIVYDSVISKRYLFLISDVCTRVHHVSRRNNIVLFSIPEELTGPRYMGIHTKRTSRYDRSCRVAQPSNLTPRTTEIRCPESLLSLSSGSPEGAVILGSAAHRLTIFSYRFDQIKNAIDQLIAIGIKHTLPITWHIVIRSIDKSSSIRPFELP